MIKNTRILIVTLHVFHYRGKICYISRCIFITTPFRLNRRSCFLFESENPTYRSYVLTTCISNWLIWKQKVCKTFLSSSRNMFLYTLKGIVSRIDVIFDWSENRRFFDICKSPIFRKFTKKMNRQNTNVPDCNIRV
jgi:hypothetical protein